MLSSLLPLRTHRLCVAKEVAAVVFTASLPAFFPSSPASLSPVVSRDGERCLSVCSFTGIERQPTPTPSSSLTLEEGERERVRVAAADDADVLPLLMPVPLLLMLMLLLLL